MSVGADPLDFYDEESHPMAYCNDSFVACDTDDSLSEKSDEEEREAQQRAMEDDLVDACNDVNRWNMDKIITHYKRMRTKSETRVNENNLVFGAENVIQLPRKYSELDKIVLSKNRNVRRNAVHIYDNEKFKETLKLFLSMKHTMNYEIIATT